MDDASYQRLADAAISSIETMFEDVDPDAIDCERAGDVLTLTFAGGARAVVNTQRPTRQIWLAATARAWHFSYDEARGAWLDDKGQGVELFAQLGAIAKDLAGVTLTAPEG